MKVPKGWRKVGPGWYRKVCVSPSVYLLDGKWYCKSDVWKPGVGPFRTAREAFRALGVEVDHG